MNQLELADFIPYYPEKTDFDFGNKIKDKQEFYELKSDATNIPLIKIGDTFKKIQSKFLHQEIIARFVSPHTIYNEHLLFHTPGTGKTCGAVAIAENFLLDPNYTKRVLVIVPKNLKSEWKRQIQFVCERSYAGKYIPDDYEKLTKLEKTTRSNKLIKANYEITTYESFRNKIKDLPDSFIKKEYSNRLIIIDEAHNLRKQKQSKDEELYTPYHKFLHLVERSKKLLLTGTPMVDTFEEIAGLLNLILPLDKQFDTKNFSQKFVKDGKLINSDEFYQPLIGVVSYVREAGDFPIRKDLSINQQFTKIIKTVSLELSDLQSRGYTEALRNDSGKDDTLSYDRVQAMNFVWEHNGKLMWYTQAQKELYNLRKIKGKGIVAVLKESYHSDLKANIKKYSAKYHYIIEELTKNPTEPMFIFNRLLSGTGGALFLGAILKLFGFKVEVITGEHEESYVKRILEDFNSPQNITGDKIQVLIGTSTIGEGASLTNVKKVVNMTPWWNISGNEQAIARGIRADSHYRTITVAQLCGFSKTIPEKDNIDIKIYKIGERKDVNIKLFERALKKISWDCELEYVRNYKKGIKGSRDCDYESCEWKCERSEHSSEPSVASSRERVFDTYRLYYSDYAREVITNEIKKLFKQTSVLDLSKIGIQSDYKLILMTIENMITNNVLVHNKWGIPCFVRSDCNKIYLTELVVDSKLSDVYYTELPMINEFKQLSEIVTNEIYSLDSETVPILEICEVGGTKKINDLSIETKIYLLESAYLIYNTSTEKRKNVKKILNHFKNNNKLFKFEYGEKNPVTMVIHTLQKEKNKDEGNYIDFKIEGSGVYRCFNFTENKWEDCDKKLSTEYSKKIQEIMGSSISETEKSIVENKYKIYGILENADLKIVDYRGIVVTEDRRNLPRGVKCGTGKFQNKDDVYTLLKELHTLDSSVLNKIPMKNEVNIKQCCELIKQWFEIKKLLIVKN